MIEFEIGRQAIPVNSQEDLVAAIKHGSERHNISNDETTLLNGLVDLIGKLDSIPLVDAVGFTLVRQSPAPDTLSISVLFPILQENENVTQAFQEVIRADGELAHVTREIMPMALSFFNSQGIDASKMKAILKKRRNIGEDFIFMAVFKRQ